MLAEEAKIKEVLETMAGFSDGNGAGTTRVAYSPSLVKACEYMAGKMKEAGLDVHIDAVGNVIGRYEGTDPDAPAIITGSHMDTVVSGGNFDGIAGVVAGLEAGRLLAANRIRLKHPFEVIGFHSEENSRFFDGLIGSRAIAGRLLPEELENAKDKDGIRLGEAMKAAGYHPELLESARKDKKDLLKYIELHIEQNFLLDRKQMDIGVVTAISGSAHDMITIKGSADHAGGTPMTERSDAMLAAAEVIRTVETAAVAAKNDTVATVGKLDVTPNYPNIIPDHVDLVVDIRSSKKECNEYVAQKIHEKLEEVCKKRGCTYEENVVYHEDPIPVSEGDMRSIEEISDVLGYSHMRLFSGAGHDAIAMHYLGPVTMIFIPSKNGKSHCPEEWTDYAYVKKGTDVLYELIQKIDKENE